MDRFEPRRFGLIEGQAAMDFMIAGFVFMAFVSIVWLRMLYSLIRIEWMEEGKQKKEYEDLLARLAEIDADASRWEETREK